MITTRPIEVLLGRYRLGQHLGQGGMSEVFAAEDLRLGRPVAIKMLRPHLGADATVRYRFEQEARTAARLSHPNVVGILDTGEEDGVAFIVMERLDGTTVCDELRQGALSEERVRSIARQVLGALAAAHDAGVIHRDIKPANLLTCTDGRVKVADFGIATAMDEAQTITGTGLLMGTPAYLAPERLSGKPASPSADLYSLAAVLYECLTWRRPFEGPTTLETIVQIRERDPRPLAELRPGVDPALAEVVERTLDKDPARRPASARAMRSWLEGSFDTETASLHLDPAATAVIPIGPPTRALPFEQPLPTPEATPLDPGPAVRRPTIGGRLPALTEALRRHRAPVAFLGAMLVALLIGLPFSGGGTPAPGRPAPATQLSSPPHHAAHHASVPAPLLKALGNLEKAAG